MSSILTNASSMAALQTLRSIDNDMSTTQNRISSGMKVESASDNASYWSIATTMRSESSSLGVVGEALGMGASVADVASTATESLVDLMSQFRDRVVASGEESNDRAKIQAELSELYTQMTETVAAASFNGQNWLNNDTDATAEVMSGVAKDGAGATTINTISVALQTADGANASTVVGTLAAIDVTGFADTAAVGTALSTIDTAIADLTELGSNFGVASKRIDIQKDFTASLMDAIDRGVGALVDADMNEESTRLKALQTQQQLGIQALSIANSSSQNILSLFR